MGDTSLQCQDSGAGAGSRTAWTTSHVLHFTDLSENLKTIQFPMCSWLRLSGDMTLWIYKGN